MALTGNVYCVGFWYRSGDDHDRSLREIPQMTGGAATLNDVYREIAMLRAQGYEVQRVAVAPYCPRCSGAGRLGSAPKGTRKDRIASLPAHRLIYRDCSVCHGEGTIGPPVPLCLHVDS